MNVVYRRCAYNSHPGSNKAERAKPGRLLKGLCML
jgi:hypothetical protein